VTAWFRRVVSQLARLLTETDTTLAEFWGSTALVAIGAWLVVPFYPDTFAAVPVYRLLGSVMAEWAWGLVCLALGFAQAGANLTRHRDARRGAAFVAAVFFGFLSSFAMIALTSSLLVPLFGTASFVEGVVFLHLRKATPPRARLGDARA
jgi:hypothetical protein